MMQAEEAAEGSQLPALKKALPPTPHLKKLLKTATSQDGTGSGFPFSKLPPEIRNMIYDMVFGATQAVAKSKAYFEPQTIAKCDDSSKICIDYHSGRKKETRFVVHGKGIHRAPLQTCKQVYAEAVAVSFENVVFRVKCIRHLNTLLKKLGKNGRAFVRRIALVDALNRSETPLKAVMRECVSLESFDLYLLWRGIKRTLGKSYEERHAMHVLRGMTLRVSVLDLNSLKGTERDQCIELCREMTQHVAQVPGSA